MPQISIRLDKELHAWLKQQIKDIKPKTTMNYYINWLLEQERSRQQALNLAESLTESWNKISIDGSLVDESWRHE